MKEEGTSENLIPSLAQILKANTLFCGGYPEYPSLFVLLVLLQKSLKLSEKLFQHRFTIGRILRQNIGITVPATLIQEYGPATD